MRFKIIPENILEWVALKFNLAPTPLVDTQVAFIAARAIMAAAKLGIYEAIGRQSKTAGEVANECNTNPAATIQLLDCLVGIGYLKWSNEKYFIKPGLYKWLLKENESNLIGKLKFQVYEWDWMSKLEDYVSTGVPIDIHNSVSKNVWESYQEGMRDLSINAAKELAKKIPVPKDATKMLDIGGSHGLYSINLCNKYPALSSTILELADAVESASAIAKRYDKTGRIEYVAGNVLADDLGTNKYDIIMINNVVHHFTAEQNIMVAKKIGSALKPGGIYAVGEFIRVDNPGEGGVVASTSGLYFSLTSSSGTWPASEIEKWQQQAGLKKEKNISAVSIPGWQMIIARK